MSTSLSGVERELLEWLLPAERTVYAPYRTCLGDWGVASRAERGDDHLVLTPPGRAADLEAPLPQVFAQGAVQTSGGEIAVTVRELVIEQLDCEISGPVDDWAARRVREIRRWSFSSWDPGRPGPLCQRPVRQVALADAVGVLAFCPTDRRLWLFDAAREIALPIPLTSYYSELMRVRGIRDPKIALVPESFFAQLDTLTDRDLARAFSQYNKIRPKIPAVRGRASVPAPKRSLRAVLRRLIGKSSQ